MPQTVSTIVLALILIAGAYTQRGQGPPLPPVPPPTPPRAQFRASVDLVHLDVSVLDRQRRPVRGLTPADFTVLENGRPQEVTVFTAVDIPEAPPPSTGWVRDVAPDVRTNAGIEERRLFLLVIDDAMIQSDVDALRSTRQIAHQIIDRLGPSDLGAVVYTRDNRQSQDYTADRARLRAAVEKFTVGFRDMSSVAGDDLYWTYSAAVVESAAKILVALPDRRKSMVYIGQGMPVDLEMSAPQAPGLPAEGGTSGLSRQGLAAQIRQLLERAFEHASRANVNIYTVDVCGLRSFKPPPPRTPGGLPPPPPTCQPGLEVEYLQQMAESTGGRAVINTNDFEPGVQAIFEENASYYLLGFQSSDPPLDGKFRRLEVRVNRPGVEVRTRSGYQPEKPEDAAKRKAELAKAPLGAALSGILPKSDLPLQMAAVPVPIPGKKESAIAIVVGVRQPIRESALRTVEKVDLQVSAFNTDGKHFASSRYQADVAIRPGATGLAEYEVLTKLELKPGRYQLRIAAHLGSLSTSGSLYYDIEVPDVSKVPLSLTGLVLTVAPGPVVAPRDFLASILPVVPTTTRTFSRLDRVGAFTRLFLSGRAPIVTVPLRIQVQNELGHMVLDRREDLPGSQFTPARTADINIELPITRLPAGEYLLTVEAGAGEAAARRDVRFVIRQGH